jgi:hypothetical protein
MTLAEAGKKLSESQQERLVIQLVLLFGVLVTAVIITGIIVFVVRKRALANDAADQEMPTLTMAQVRELHRNGEIDDAQYERLRNAVLTQAGGSVPTVSPQAPPEPQAQQADAEETDESDEPPAQPQNESE